MAKFASGLYGADRILDKMEPLFLLSYKAFFLIFGCLEFALSLICFLSNNILLRSVIIAWFATSALLYRISMPWIGYHRPCPCLGSLTGAIHVPPHIADNVMKGVLAYLLIGSYGILLYQWRENRKLAVGRLELDRQKT